MYYKDIIYTKTKTGKQDNICIAGSLTNGQDL